MNLLGRPDIGQALYEAAERRRRNRRQINRSNCECVAERFLDAWKRRRRRGNIHDRQRLPARGPRRARLPPSFYFMISSSHKPRAESVDVSRNALDRQTCRNASSGSLNAPQAGRHLTGGNKAHTRLLYDLSVDSDDAN